MNFSKFTNTVKKLTLLSGVALSGTLLSLPALAQLNPRPSIFNEPLYNSNTRTPATTLPEVTPSVPLSPGQPTPDMIPQPISPGNPGSPDNSAPGGTPFPGSIAPEDPQFPSQTIPSNLQTPEQIPNSLPPDLEYPNQANPNRGSGYDPIGPDRR